MKFKKYCQQAIANYQRRLQTIRNEIAHAQKSGDTAALQAAKRRLATQHLTLAAIFAFLFCCLLLSIFGI